MTECLAQNKLKYALLTHRFGALYYKSVGTDIHMKNIAASFLLGVFLTAPLQAATLSSNSGPSELPPASFSGGQFVDSKGCVYLRAGHSGAVEWVPRVTRDRKLVCGFQPSFAKTQAQQIVKSAPRTVASKSVAQGKKPIPTVASTVATQPVRTKPIVLAPKIIAQKPVRTASVQVAPKTTPVTTQVVRPANPAVKVPAGYRKAWTDDRLNVKRAIQTAKGIQASDLIWTRTVPRQLIHRPSGQDVTANFDKLIYPFTDINQQKTYLAARDRLDIVARPDGAIFLVPKEATASVTRQMQKTNYSSASLKSTKPASTKRASNAVSAGAKYVQVGTFGVSSNASKTAARLTRLGLPVRSQKITRSGKSYTVVMAGPFSSHSDVRSALSSARKAGFSDAFAR